MDKEKLEKLALAGNLLETLNDSIRVHSKGIVGHKKYLQDEQEKRTRIMEPFKEYVKRGDITLILKSASEINLIDQTIRFYQDTIERYVVIVEQNRKEKDEVLVELTAINASL